ncbi:MAG: glucose-6-phosphate dehydrogenase [Candidatus Peribacteraceae bacterium]|nr:glucose-6-phosphate dehydrogenase [Candidatus Peribacteraceae bacterium]
MTTITNTSFSLIIFGASGHLAQLKLYPELYVLALKKRLPKDYAIVGFSRKEMSSDEFKKLVEDSVRTNMPAVTEDALKDFLAHVHYHQGQYSEEADFSKLNDELNKIESGWENPACTELCRSVRLAYFSIPPTVFADTAHNLCKGGVHNKEIPFRCIVEKPVGHDQKSFEKIKKELVGCFKEEEIYLLDHYLGKEAVRNIFYLRYANPVVEQILSGNLIHHVEVTAFESQGLEGRAGYFEETGTFRDMFQSHMLMMASLLTMNLVEKESSLIKSRSEALKQFYLPPASNLDEIVLQGQYDSYSSEDGIEKNSRTNTFAALKLLSRNKDWQGVPFYLRSGKKLEKKETRISITFIDGPDSCEGACANCLDIILQGEAGMRLHLQTKKGGSKPEFRKLLLEDPLVCEGDCLPEHSLLILEAIYGKKQWFLTFDEIQTAWRLVDPVQAHLEQDSTSIFKYKAGTNGPEEANEWVKRDGINWM